jgi:endo-1,4-beta-xylanase
MKMNAIIWIVRRHKKILLSVGLSQLIFLFLCGQNIPLAVSVESGSQELQQLGAPLAAGQSKFLGCAWSSGQNTNFVKYWNQVTPENGGKWGSVEYTRDAMNWTALDAAYNLAKANNYPFKLHTLIWGAQQPSWMAGLDSANQRQEIEEWFSALAARYDSFAYVEVVNEPIHNAPNGMLPWGSTTPNINYAKALGGAGETGWDWVITSFRLARQYFPKSKLILNEYSVINSTTTTQQYIGIINLLKAENLIDGIGEQAHAFTTYGTTTSTMKDNLDALAETGLPIYLTELDIDGATDLIQLNEYRRIFPFFWEHPAMGGITLWGFRYGLWRTDQGAYLVTSTGVERPAFTWLKAYVNDTLTLTQSISVNSSDDNDTIFIDEPVQMSPTVLPANTTIPNVTWSLSPAGIATINATGLLTPVTVGKVTVRATAWDGSGVTGTRVIQIINRLAQSVTVSATGDIDTIAVGETLQMMASVLPENTTNPDIAWSVTPAENATINQNGILTAKTNGKVTVKATAMDGSGVADTMAITIIEILAQSIELSAADDIDTIVVEETLQMHATVLPENTTNPAFVWSVSPEGLAGISTGGLLTATAIGNVTVTATALDGSGVTGTFNITIESIPTGLFGNFLSEGIKVYPNPAVDGRFTIQGIDKISQVIITDLFGRMIQKYNLINQPKLEISLNNRSGIYFISLSNGKQAVYTKIIVE